VATAEELKARACAAIDQRRDTIVGIAREMLDHPETGFREVRTARVVARAFGDLGLSYREGLALTGVLADVAAGAGSGPTVALMGEPDALGVPDNPRADPTTGAVHACEQEVDRALRGAAIAVGAGLEITTLPGYMPLSHDPNLSQLYRQNASRLVDEREVVANLGHRSASADMGDVSQIMPVLHPYAGGATGQGHGSDYEIVDYETAAVVPAKCMAMTVIDLLASRAGAARRVLAEHRPAMTKEEYLARLRGLAVEQRFSDA